MRPFELLLSAGLALSSMPASAAAVRGDAPENMIVAYAGCPVYEGYPDCRAGSDTPATGSRTPVRRQS